MVVNNTDASLKPETRLEVYGDNEKVIFEAGAIREYCFGTVSNAGQYKSVSVKATVFFYKPGGPYEQNINNNSLTKTAAVPPMPVPGITN
jgi:hypothetical protein